MHTVIVSTRLRIVMVISWLSSSPSGPDIVAEASTPEDQSVSRLDGSDCPKTYDTIWAHSSSVPG